MLGLVITYDVFMMHFKSSNFKGLIKNIRSMRKSLKHFVSDQYTPSDNPCPEPIFPVKDPGSDDNDKKSK